MRQKCWRAVRGPIPSLPRAPRFQIRKNSGGFPRTSGAPSGRRRLPLCGARGHLRFDRGESKVETRDATCSRAFRTRGSHRGCAQAERQSKREPLCSSVEPAPGRHRRIWDKHLKNIFISYRHYRAGSAFSLRLKHKRPFAPQSCRFGGRFAHKF